MKQLIKKTPLYPAFKSVRLRIDAARKNAQIAKSPPYEVEYFGATTRFKTDTPYTHGWFYPRYAEGKQHEQQATSKFVEASLNAKVIVDVGANLGWFTCIAACQSKQAKVHSFELDRANCDVSANNIRLNRLANVDLQHAAVTNYDGELTYQKDKSAEASPMHRLGKQAEVSCKARAIKLDTYFADRPKPEVMKIDVEGAEQLVLEGMIDLLHEASLKTILVEIHPQWLNEMGGSVREVCELLGGAGFSLCAIEHRADQSEEKPVCVSDIEAIEVGGQMFIARKA